MKTQGKVWILFDTETKSQSKPMSIVQAQVILLSLSPLAMEKFLIWTPGWESWQTVKNFLASDQNYFAIVQPPTPAGHSTSTVAERLDGSSQTVTQNVSGESPFTHVIVNDDPVRHQQTGGYYFQDFNGDDLDLQEINRSQSNAVEKNRIELQRSKPTIRDGSERRAEPRHNFKIEVVLVSKTRSFRTYSKNISITGTLLEHEVPKDFLNKPFDLIIVNPFETDRTKARLLFKAKIVGDLVDPRRLMFFEQDSEMTYRLNALLQAYVVYQTQIHRKQTGT